MRNTLGISLAILAVFFSSLATAETPEPKKRTEAEEKKITELRKLIGEKKKDLNGSTWELTFNSSTDPKMKGQKDTFVFQDGQFKSAHYGKRGFSPTNYTISIPSEGSETAVWETMLTGKEGIVFIRGEWEKETMRGSITEQLEGGKKVKEHSFSTSARKAIPPQSSKEGNEAQPAEPKTDGGASTAMVSKEKKTQIEVAAFSPGTTDEVRS